ncbi:MAG: hypothetical protein R3Y65_08820 [Bacillota bacterium]
MNNNSRKIRIITIIMLLSLLTTLFSACAVTASDYFTAEMPSVESVVGYSVDDVAYETETIQTLADTADGSDSVMKLSETGATGESWSAVVTAAQSGTDYVEDSGNLTIYTAAGLAYFADQVNNQYYIFRLHSNPSKQHRFDNSWRDRL